jgi:hypothetical protein
VNDLAFVQVVDCFEHLLDGLRGVLLGELALVADPVEELSTSSELGDNVVFVLAHVSLEKYWAIAPTYP